jgi:transcription termination factor Rho
MTRAELESKHLAELHALAEEAGVQGYRMLSREELIEKLSDGSGSKPQAKGGRPEQGQRQRRPRERRPRERREGGQRQGPRSKRPGGPRDSKPAASEGPPERPSAPEPSSAPATPPPASRPKRRRRRRFRRRKELRAHELLLPPVAGRQAIVYADTREGCTALLRELAAELSGGRGPDPIALLIDPSPEELADWKREAPAVEIVSAGQERHADDALAQAMRRAQEGEDVIVLVDSLNRHTEAFGDVDAAKELFNGGLGLDRAGSGSLTVVAALQRSR